MIRNHKLDVSLRIIITVVLITIIIASCYLGYYYVTKTTRFFQLSQLESIQKNKQLKILVVNSPFELVWAKDYQGFNSDLADAFAEYLGVELVVNFAHSDDSALKSQADVIIGANSDAQLLRSEPIFIQHLQLVSLSSSKPVENISQIASIPDFRIGINRLNFEKREFQQVIDQLDKIDNTNLWHIFDENSATLLLLALIDKRVDYAIADSISVAIFRRIYPEIKLQFNVLEDQPVMWQFTGSQEDRSLLNAFQTFHNLPETADLLDKLQDKYFSHISNFDLVDTHRFIRSIKNTLPIYQPLFQAYSKAFDWRLIAAIAYQESRWDPDAKSPTGVRGMMMLTRDTASYLGIKDRSDIDNSIEGGIRYLNFIMERIPDSIEEDERIWFALAAYNMGIGHLWDVRDLTRERGGDPDSWNDVKQNLGLLSDEQIYPNLKYGYARGYEAFTYVENVRRYYTSLIGYFSILEQFTEKQ